MKFRMNKHTVMKSAMNPHLPPKTTVYTTQNDHSSAQVEEEITYRLALGSIYYFITEEYVHTNRNANMLTEWAWMQSEVRTTASAFYTSKDMIERRAKIRTKEPFGKIGERNGMVIIRLPKNPRKIAFIAVDEGSLFRTDIR